MSGELVKRLRNDAFGGYCNKRNIKQAAARISALEAALAKADELADMLRSGLPAAGKPITSQADLDGYRALIAYRQARDATT